MAQDSVSKRYARALFDLALEQNALEEVFSDMHCISGLDQKSPEFSRFLSQPFLSGQVCRAALEALFKSRAHPLVYRFLFFLIDKRRLSVLPQIAQNFVELYQVHKNILEAKVFVSRKLSAPQTEDIKRRLVLKFKKDVRLNVDENPQLLGGMKIQVGDYVFDDSFATQLERFHSNLLFR